MQRAVELAGFYAAHAIWCVSDGEALVPMLGQESPTQGRNMIRFALDRLEDGVKRGQDHLRSNPERCERAALVYDGYITVASDRSDALFIVIRSYVDPGATLTMAIPYRNASDPQGFAVHRPKIVDWQGSGQPDYIALTEAFFRGVESHEKGAAVWNAALHESI